MTIKILKSLRLSTAIQRSVGQSYILTHEQSALIDLFNDNNKTISISQRNTGMTLATCLYMIYLLEQQKTQRICIVFRTNSAKNNFFGVMNTVLSKVQCNIHIAAEAIYNYDNHNVLYGHTIDAYITKLRGTSPLDVIVFDDYTGHCQHSIQVEYELAWNMMAMVMHPHDLKVHLIGSNSLPFVHTTLPEDGLLANTLAGKTNFVMHNCVKHMSYVDDMVNV